MEDDQLSYWSKGDFPGGSSFHKWSSLLSGLEIGEMQNLVAGRPAVAFVIIEFMGMTMK